MSASDGTVLGLSKILDNGPDAQRLTLVLVAEGFRSNEQAEFEAKCSAFLTGLNAEPWFATLQRAFNVYRLNVASDESGADDPTECGGTGATPSTFFDASFCHGGLQRLLEVDDDLVEEVLDEQLEAWDFAVVLVNSAIPGGSGGVPVMVASTVEPFFGRVMHEIGHGVFGLGDEYLSYGGCDQADPEHDTAPSDEPVEPNVTAARTRDTLKWAHLVDPATPVPTMLNPDCSHCDDRPNPLAGEYEVGLFEGAQYYHCGLFRGAYTCKMREEAKHFCPVCVDAMHDQLRPLMGSDPVLASELSTVEFGSVALGLQRERRFHLANLGIVDVTGIELEINGPDYTATMTGPGDVLGPGEQIEITVTILPTFVLGTRQGTLTVTSDAPTLTIPLTATICEPLPLSHVIADGASSSLDFGEVATGLTMVRSLEVQNLVGTCPAPLDVTLELPAGAFRRALGTPESFTLSAPEPDGLPTTREVRLEFVAPTLAGPTVQATLRIHTPGDRFAGLREILLTARPVAPKPVDTVLVVDRSGSMSESTGEAGRSKIDHAIEAGKLFVGLLRDDDTIGIVRYNSHSRTELGDQLLALTTAGPQDGGAGRAAALAALEIVHLIPSGNTSIGAGILLGSETLNQGESEARAMVVLTDGRQNREPDVAEAQDEVEQTSPRQRVFAVGLGLNQLESTLQEIAGATNGTSQITGQLAGDQEFLLQKMYVQILSDVSDEAFVQDPRLTIPPGRAVATDVWVGEVDVTMDFLVVLRPTRSFPTNARMWLESPGGARFDVDHTTPGVRVVEGDSFTIFRTRFFGPAAPTPHVGRWRVWVQNRLTESGGRADRLLHCAVMAKARSNLVLRGHLIQTEYIPGARMTVVLEPTLFGEPVALDRPVLARVRRPDGRTRIVELHPTRSGGYVGHYDETWLPGSYRVEADVTTSTPRGVRLTRYRHLTGVVLTPKSRRPRSRAAAISMGSPQYGGSIIASPESAGEEPPRARRRG